MPNQRFTSLPVVSSAQMSDIICAVQGGLSVQETLGQVYDLFQSNVILSNAGNPNGVVSGNTYQLLWDTIDNILWVCTTSGTSVTAEWTKSISLIGGSGVTINQSGSTITISISGSGFSWTQVTGTSATMVTNNGYQANNTALVTLALPTVSSFGDIIHIAGYGTGLWQISQAAGQEIIIGSASSTSGTGGSLSSTNQYDSIILYCAVANTTWQALGSAQGILTIV